MNPVDEASGEQPQTQRITDLTLQGDAASTQFGELGEGCNNGAQVGWRDVSDVIDHQAMTASGYRL